MAQRRVERAVASADRLMRSGRTEQARAVYGEAATLQSALLRDLAPGRLLDTLVCGCVLLYRLAGSPVEARGCAEGYLKLAIDEAAEGWLMDQVSELTLGSYLSNAGGTQSAMSELIKLRDRVG